MTEEPEEPEFTVEEEKFEKEIKVEINKLEYHLQDAEELIINQDLKEIKVTSKRTDEILDRLNELVLRTHEELKIERGHIQRSVRQWKKDVSRSTPCWLKKM